MSKSWDQVLAELSAPFRDDEVSYKPQVFRGDKTAALATTHIDARTVMDRLDEVVGPGNWSDEYHVVEFTRMKPVKSGAPVPETSSGVVCKLTVMGVTKSDVGVPSDYEATKGAFSDAMKRAGVKFGIARYLYNMDTPWIPWDQGAKGGRGDWAGQFPVEHWRLAGVESRHPQYPAGVEVMTDVDFYEFYMEVEQFTRELEELEENEVMTDVENYEFYQDQVNLGALVDKILEETESYKSQNEIVAKLTKAKENGDIEELGSYSISGATDLPFDVAFKIAAYLLGANARLKN